MKLAAEQVRGQLLDLAAEVLKTGPEDLDIEEGRIFVKDDPEKVLTVAEACRLAIRTKKTVPLTAYVGL